MTIAQLRIKYLTAICDQIIRIQEHEGIEYPNFADVSNQTSRQIAWGIVDQIGCERNYKTMESWVE